MQRIQVGVIGLAAVLLLVSVANFVIQRASDEQTVIEELQEAELGITPAPESGAGKAGAQKPATNLPGQTVPDLKPDPNLDAPMDRERR